MPEKPRSFIKSIRPLPILLGLILILLSGCLLAASLLLPLVVEEYHQLPRELSDLISHQPSPPGFDLGAAQRAQIQASGYPEAFTLYFYTPQTGSGLQTMRHEIWHYYRLGKSFTYVNGELVEEFALDPLGLAPTPPAYRPEMFSAGTNLEQVISAAGLSEMISLPLEHDLLPDSAVFYARRLLFGLQGDQLRYIEVLPFETASTALHASLIHTAWNPARFLDALPPSTPPGAISEFSGSLLLQLAAYGNLSVGLEVPAAVESGAALLRVANPLQQKSSLERLNEHRRLAAEFRRLAAHENASETMQRHWLEKARYHEEQARLVERHRQRRGWIRRFVRQLGDFLSDYITDRMDGLAAQVEFIVEERLPYRIRNVVGLADDLLQQFIDQKWDLLDQQLGIFPVDGIRQVVDGWWLNVRDQLTRHKPPQPGQPAAPGNAPPAESASGGSPATGIDRFNINWHQGTCSAGEDYPFQKGVYLSVRPDGAVQGTIRLHDCPNGGSVVYRVTGSPEPDASSVLLSGEKIDGAGPLDEDSPLTQNFTFNVTPENYGLNLAGP